jgi:hypothetical protein
MPCRAPEAWTSRKKGFASPVTPRVFGAPGSTGTCSALLRPEPPLTTDINRHHPCVVASRDPYRHTMLIAQITERGGVKASLLNFHCRSRGQPRPAGRAPGPHGRLAPHAR